MSGVLQAPLFFKVIFSYDKKAICHVGGFAVGDFTKRLTERRMHTETVQGHCLICGSYGRLSWDHVPPKGGITITKIEQVHLTEVTGIDSVPVKGVKSSNGSKFKTICKTCNSNHLGANDQEVARNSPRQYSITFRMQAII